MLAIDNLTAQRTTDTTFTVGPEAEGHEGDIRGCRVLDSRVGPQR